MRLRGQLDMGQAHAKSAVHIIDKKKNETQRRENNVATKVLVCVQVAQQCKERVRERGREGGVAATTSTFCKNLWGLRMAGYHTHS